MRDDLRRDRELGFLTDSPSSAIRWRHEDYGEMLRAQLVLLAAAPSDDECLDAPLIRAVALARARHPRVGRPSPDRGG